MKQINRTWTIDREGIRWSGRAYSWENGEPDPKAVEIATAFLKLCRPMQRLGLKSRFLATLIEEWHEDTHGKQQPELYISDGAVIQAAVNLGFPITTQFPYKTARVAVRWISVKKVIRKERRLALWKLQPA